MKKLILTIVAIQFSVNLFSQIWDLMNVDSTDSDLFDVTFIDENIGYIVGGDSAANNAVMYYTSDGGETWIDTNFSVYALWSVQFLNSQTGFVATLNANPKNLIFKTSDGGANWTAITTAINNDGKIYFKDTSIGFHYSIDNADDVAYTTDGGDTWTRYVNGTFGGNGLAEIQFTEGTSIGYAITSTSGKIYKTTSDTAWSLLATPSSKNYNAMYFVSDNIGYIIADDEILKTTDGGSNWTSVSSQGGIDIKCADENYCIVLEEDNMHYTEDGFTSIYPSLIDTAFTGMKTINEYDDDEFTPSIAVGTDGKAFRLVVFENVNEISRKYELSIYPNPVTDGLFTLKLSNPLIDESQIFIYTIDGRMVYQEKLPLENTKLV